MTTLNGRVVIITGASSGFGEHAARLFSREGCQVVLAARRLEKLEVLAGEIRAKGGEALPIATDVTQHDQIQAMVKSTIDRYGRIDILFNNAGFGRLDWLEALDPIQDIERQIIANLLGVIWTARAVLPQNISREIALYQAAQVGAMVAALASGDYALLGRAIDDRIAEPARTRLLPGFAEAKRAALNAGALGSSISGAGPTAFALTRGAETAQRVSEAMTAAYAAKGFPSQARIARVDRRGARLIEPEVQRR